jgi:hypothetical protein
MEIAISDFAGAVVFLAAWFPTADLLPSSIKKREPRYPEWLPALPHSFIHSQPNRTNSKRRKSAR